MNCFVKNLESHLEIKIDITKRFLDVCYCNDSKIEMIYIKIKFNLIDIANLINYIKIVVKINNRKLLFAFLWFNKSFFVPENLVPNIFDFNVVEFLELILLINKQWLKKAIKFSILNQNIFWFLNWKTTIKSLFDLLWCDAFDFRLSFFVRFFTIFSSVWLFCNRFKSHYLGKFVNFLRIKQKFKCSNDFQNQKNLTVKHNHRGIMKIIYILSRDRDSRRFISQYRL